MKRIITFIALPLAIAVHAAGATNYGFYLGGVPVTSDNCSNITGSNITAYSSAYPCSAVYNPSTKTLTLSNVLIERSGSYNRAILNESCDGLKVVFERANRMEAKDSSPLRFNAATTLTSPNGNLTVSGGSEDAITVGSGASLTITDALIRVYSNSHGIIGDTGNETLVISETNIDVKCEKEDYNSLRDFKSLSVISSRVSLRTTSLAPAVVNLKAFTMSGDRMCTLMQTYDAQKKTFVFPGGGTSYYGYIAPAVAFSDRSVFPDENFANELSPQSGLIYDDYTIQYIVLPTKHHAGTAQGRWRVLGPLPKNIYSLKGIEYATDLQELYCDSLQLTSLDLSANTKLNTLWCSANKLTTLQLPDSNLLTTLYCDHNRLTSLDLSSYPLLKEVRCNANPIRTLSVMPQTNLNTLRCDSCNLSTLNLSQNYMLKNLYCNNNKLTSLSLPTSESLLENLDCHNNQLTTLSVARMELLKELDCSNNKITNLDISYASHITKLLCQNNCITSLDLSRGGELVDLDCSNNKLTSLDFTWCSKLGSTVNCFGNQISGDAVTQLVESLPNSPYGRNLNFVNHQDLAEGNTISAVQNQTAQPKRWKICHLLPKATDFSPIGLSCVPLDLKIANHTISSCYCGHDGSSNIAELFDEMSGFVGYSTITRILTLDNATITHPNRGIDVGKEFTVFIIKLKGTNAINHSKSGGIAINLHNVVNHYINGDGTLNISVPDGTTASAAIYLENYTEATNHRLHIEDCTMNVSGRAEILEIDGDNNLTIDHATLRMSNGSISVGNNVELVDCYISKPVGGHIVGGSLCAAGSNSYFMGEIEILPGNDFLKGDVDGNGKVNVSDVSALINMILGIIAVDSERGDVNGDGRVNVSDVSTLINIILGID